MNYRRSSGISRQVLEARVKTARTARQKQALAWRMLAGIAIFAATISLSVAGSRYLARKMFHENGEYAIRHLDVTTDGILTPEKILAAAKVKAGDNLFALDLSQVRRHLEAVPSIRKAEVARALPDRLIIRVEERKPLARIRLWGRGADGRAALVEMQLDDDGVVLRPRATAGGELPLLTGYRTERLLEGQVVEEPGLVAAVALLKRLETSTVKSGLDIAQVDVGGADYMTVRTTDGTSVKLLHRFAEGHIRRLEYIVSYAQAGSRVIQTADLTVDRNVPVTFKP